MRELESHLPDGAERVLEYQSYWDPGFCERFLERCRETIFDNPPAGLKLAEVAPRLARSVPEDRGAQGRRKQRERIVRAYILLGHALKEVGRPTEADTAYQEAFRICQEEKISASIRAFLHLKLAVLRSCQKRYQEALRLTSEATEMYRTEKDLEGEGIALATLGMVHIDLRLFDDAVSVLTMALSKYRLNHRAHYAACGNLAFAVSEAVNPDFDAALKHLRRARQILGPRRSIQKSRLYWIEGSILNRCGLTERAEHRWRKAQAEFVKFQAPYEVALVGLEISTLLRFQKRWPELEHMAADTYRRFNELREDNEALAALKLWLEAAQDRTLSEVMIAEVKAKLEERMRFFPGTAPQHR